VGETKKCTDSEEENAFWMRRALLSSRALYLKWSHELFPNYYVPFV